MRIAVILCFVLLSNRAFCSEQSTCRDEIIDASSEQWSMEERHQLVRWYGDRSYLAYSNLQPGLKYFDLKIGERKAFLAYQRRLGIPLVLGNPIAHPEDMRTIIQAFQKKFSGTLALEPSYCSVSRPVAVILNELGQTANEIGKEAVHDLTTLNLGDPTWSRIRQRAKETNRKGFVIQERTWAEERLLDPQLSEHTALTDSWRRSRAGGGNQLSFLNRPFPLDDEPEVRTFFVRHHGKLIAYYTYDPLYENGKVMGYLLNFKRYSLNREIFPNFVDAGVFHHVVERFQSEGLTRFSLGISALYNIEDATGGLHYNPATSQVLRLIYQSSVPPSSDQPQFLAGVRNFTARQVRGHLFNFHQLADHKFNHRHSGEEPQYFTGPSSPTQAARVVALSVECGFLGAVGKWIP